MIEKKCIKCGVVKPLGAFSRCAKARDGRQAYCYACSREICLSWRKSHRERARELARRAYDRKDSARSVDGAKRAAQRALNYAVGTGKMVRGTRCERCGYSGPGMHGHHPDYARPLDVTWLCVVCHAAVHGNAGRKPSPGGPAEAQKRLEAS